MLKVYLIIGILVAIYNTIDMIINGSLKRIFDDAAMRSRNYRFGASVGFIIGTLVVILVWPIAIYYSLT